MAMSDPRAAAVRELLVVIGLAVAGLLVAAVVTFGTFPFEGEHAIFTPIVDVMSPDNPLT